MAHAVQTPKRTKRPNLSRDVRRPDRPSKRRRAQQAHVAEFQRARLLRAMARVASERGYHNTTVAAVLAEARVSRKTFYELFESCEDCFLASCEDTLVEIAAMIAPAYFTDGAWHERVRAALALALDFLDGDHGVAALTVGYLIGVAPERHAGRENALRLLREAIHAGRLSAPKGLAPPSLTAEMLVGGGLAVIHERLLLGGASLADLVNPMMSMIVLPYLGADAAAREMVCKPPQLRGPVPRLVSNPLKPFGTRLTYRTVRVIAAVAQTPGTSNVEVGLKAGIRDQGQLSKLLARLARVGVIQNIGDAHIRSAPNMWCLTPAGREAYAEILRQSEPR
jgi:AcrR family transcriptional regulator